MIGLRSLLLGSAALLAAPLVAGAQDEVKLGAFLPISGISADVGAQIKAGAEIALERMATVQVGGKPMKVRVICYDDEGKGDVGPNVVTRALTVDKIHVGMGFLSSDVFIRVMDEFCAIGSWGGQRPSVGGYVTGTGATNGAPAAGGRSCRLSSSSRAASGTTRGSAPKIA